MIYINMSNRVCAICGKPFSTDAEWEDRHATIEGEDCHAECCPTCDCPDEDCNNGWIVDDLGIISPCPHCQPGEREAGQ